MSDLSLTCGPSTNVWKFAKFICIDKPIHISALFQTDPATDAEAQQSEQEAEQDKYLNLLS